MSLTEYIKFLLFSDSALSLNNLKTTYQQTCFIFPVVKVGEISDRTCFHLLPVSEISIVSDIVSVNMTERSGIELNSLINANLKNSGSATHNVGLLFRNSL